jgi:hypothetical protein
MKTTLELDDDLFRQAKASAALLGESLKDFFAAALRAHLENQGAKASATPGWRRVFGQAKPEDVAEVDRIVAEELERIEPDSWK